MHFSMEVMDKAHITKGKLEIKLAGETDLSLLKMPLELIVTQLIWGGGRGSRTEFCSTDQGQPAHKTYHQPNPLSYTAKGFLVGSPPWQHAGFKQTISRPNTSASGAGGGGGLKSSLGDSDLSTIPFLQNRGSCSAALVSTGSMRNVEP